MWRSCEGCVNVCIFIMVWPAAAAVQPANSAQLSAPEGLSGSVAGLEAGADAWVLAGATAVVDAANEAWAGAPAGSPPGEGAGLG